MATVQDVSVDREASPAPGVFGIREVAVLLVGVFTLTAGAIVFITDRFHLVFIVVLIAAWVFGLHRAVRVVRTWRIKRTPSPLASASNPPSWRVAAIVSATTVGTQLTLIGAATFLQLTPNENWFKLYVLGLLALPATLLTGPMLLIQHRWAPDTELLEAEAAALREPGTTVRKAVLATRVLAAISWALALLLTLAVIGLLIVVLQAH